jgi:DNA polymerase III epsilon subunit-like protein
MYLFFDTETTGANKARDRTVQLAWILTDEFGRDVAKKCFTIKPSGFDIPGAATAIHGISTKQAYSVGIDLEHVLSDFLITLNKASIIVAHNIDFDVAILRNDLAELGFNDPFLSKDRICTMRASAAWCRIPHFNGKSGFKWPKLEELHFRLFGEYIDGAHDALVDVEATKRCFFKLQEIGVIDKKAFTSKTQIAMNANEPVNKVRLAAEQGLAAYQALLGLMYAEGDGVAQNIQEAVKWWLLAAEQGIAEAQLVVGNHFSSGEGVAQNDKEAVRWWRLAAEQGNAKAQFHLGQSYDDGKGVIQNDQEAVKWWRLAAEQGNSDSRIMLGMHFSMGKGVEQNDHEAEKWIRLAAEQGSVDAQYLLGSMYQRGISVVQNDANAYVWLKLAADQGLTNAAALLDSVHANLSPQALREAETTAKSLAKIFSKTELKD